MENGSKIVELLSEMLRKFDVLTGTVVNLTGRVDKLSVTVDSRLGKVENEIVKLNLIHQKTQGHC